MYAIICTFRKWRCKKRHIYERKKIYIHIERERENEAENCTRNYRNALALNHFTSSDTFLLLKFQRTLLCNKFLFSSRVVGMFIGHINARRDVIHTHCLSSRIYISQTSVYVFARFIENCIEKSRLCIDVTKFFFFLPPIRIDRAADRGKIAAGFPEFLYSFCFNVFALRNR